MKTLGNLACIAIVLSGLLTGNILSGQLKMSLEVPGIMFGISMLIAFVDVVFFKGSVND